MGGRTDKVTAAMKECRLPQSMHWTLALVLAWFFSHAGQAQTATQLYERHTYQVWNTGTGLPQDTVRQFLQTRDGYLWMATDGGLVRFDGFEFTSFNRRNTPNMQSDLINALLEDSNGHLWIATSNGLIEKTGDTFLRYSTEQGLPSDAILTIRQDTAGGSICVDTSNGPACMDRSGFNTLPRKPLLLQAPSHTLQATARDGTSWSTTATGLLRRKAGREVSVALPEGFSSGDILALYVDQEDDLWIGSETAGAAVLRTPPFTTLGRRDGLAADQVRSLLQDARGDLWFGTSSGLSRLHDGAFSIIGKQTGPLKGASDLVSDEIIALAGSGIDDLWAGTPDGLSHLHGKIVTTLTASDGLPDDNIRSLLESRDGSLWVGTTHGLAHLAAAAPGIPAKASDIKTYTTADGLASDVIGSLLEDADGSLWIGTRGGLSHLRNGRLASYAGREGLKARGGKPGIITALGRDSRGTLWVGTAGDGLYAWENGRLLQVKISSDGELPETAFGLLDDGQGQMWISSPDGIYRIAIDDLHALAEKPAPARPLAVTHYGVADGLRINDCGSGGHPEAIRAVDGHLFFATSKGVSMVDARDRLLQQQAPPVVLQSVTVDDAFQAAGRDTGTALQVPAGRERVAFHYAGLNFAAPSKVRYRYQLEHFDHTWIDAGTRRTAYYTNIPPGKYTFRVLASINGGSWSEQAAEISLVIAPHYYQTWWFYTLLVMLLAFITWQLYLYRLRQVELRFHAVLAERGRIAREIHDTLAQDIVAISVQLDLVSRLMTLSVEKAREQLVATRNLVRKSLAEARSSIWDLRSTSSEGVATNDLPTRVREVTRQVVGDAPIKLNLQITGTYRAAPRALEDELLRIAQEAVTNAVRHAEPQTIDVSLTYQARGVDLCVRDDGRGFTASGARTGPAGHYGIRGMHERAERAHAQLSIESSAGAGTTVIAQVDIP